jgi:Helix-turn-helix domain
MKLEKPTFGPVMRAARERRGISLHQLADDTKVSVDRWRDFEDNDFTRWPSRIYARTYVREYAMRVGLDPDAIVNEFCRLFPEQGDRRSEGLLREHAAIVQHDLAWQDEGSAAREQWNRRASDRAASSEWPSKNRDRLFAIGIDIGTALVLAGAGVLLHLGFWHSLAVSALAYHAVGVFVLGRTVGIVLSDWSTKTFRAKPATRGLVSSRAGTV